MKNIYHFLQFCKLHSPNNSLPANRPSFSRYNNREFLCIPTVFSRRFYAFLLIFHLYYRFYFLLMQVFLFFLHFSFLRFDEFFTLKGQCRLFVPIRARTCAQQEPPILRSQDWGFFPVIYFFALVSTTSFSRAVKASKDMAPRSSPLR